MIFLAEELTTFSIKTFNLQNLLKFNNIRLWPLKNSSVAHSLRNPVLVLLLLYEVTMPVNVQRDKCGSLELMKNDTNCQLGSMKPHISGTIWKN